VRVSQARSATFRGLSHSELVFKALSGHHARLKTKVVQKHAAALLAVLQPNNPPVKPWDEPSR
jgi:hypothetical protein